MTLRSARGRAGLKPKRNAAGITVDLDRGIYLNGIFARLSDPEGNPIHLWEERWQPSWFDKLTMRTSRKSPSS